MRDAAGQPRANTATDRSLTPLRERFAAQALEPDGRTPEAFGAFVARAIARNQELVKLAGIEPQ